MNEICTILEDGKILIKIDESVYEKEAVMATTYKMTDSYFVQVMPSEENSLNVYLEPKNNQDDAGLKLTAKMFCNELLDQQVRLDTERQFSHLRHLLVKQAFSPIENIQDKTQ